MAGSGTVVLSPVIQPLPLVVSSIKRILPMCAAAILLGFGLGPVGVLRKSNEFAVNKLPMSVIKIVTVSQLVKSPFAKDKRKSMSPSPSGIKVSVLAVTLNAPERNELSVTETDTVAIFIDGSIFQ